MEILGESSWRDWDNFTTLKGAVVVKAVGQKEASGSEVIAQILAFCRGEAPAPRAADTVQWLLAAEKACRQNRQPYRQPLAAVQLLGHWRLVFITGTQRSRRAAGGLLGAGRFLPRWIKIAIAYKMDAVDARPEFGAGKSGGRVENRVCFGGVDLTVAGPTQLYSRQRILAFDFVRVCFRLAGLTLFDGYVKGGQGREQAFAQKQLKDQAFFTYFWAEGPLIAARGRGGGLAIWVRDPVARSEGVES